MAAISGKVTFGTEVRRLRLRSGLSLRALALRCSVSAVYISDIENGRKPAPSSEILRKLIIALHADADTMRLLAVQSLEEFGGEMRKPRLEEKLSAVEYMLILRRKYSLQPDEYKVWLNMPVVMPDKDERKVRRRIKEIVLQRMIPEQPELQSRQETTCLCQSETSESTSSAASRTIRHYEGQRYEDALDIFVDTCYREWKSLKTPYARQEYLSSLETLSYAIVHIHLSTAHSIE